MDSEQRNRLTWISASLGIILFAGLVRFLSSRHGSEEKINSSKDTTRPSPEYLKTLPRVDERYPDIVKDSSHVYQMLYNEPIEGADPLTFKILSDSYARDKNNAYEFQDGNGFVRIVGADTNSVKVLNDGYTKDFRRVYFMGYVVKEADYSTFKTVAAHRWFATDAAHVFVRGVLLPHLNPKNLTFVGSNYVKDSNVVYCGASGDEWFLVEGADAKTFVAIDEHRSKDAKHVFYDGRLDPTRIQ